jgi:hypothetical protein
VPSGVYRAIIHAAPWQDTADKIDDGFVDITIPQLTGNFIYKNVPCLGFHNTGFYNAGDAVYVAPVDGRSDDFLVLGPQRSARTMRPIVEQQAVFSWPGTPLSTEQSGSFAFTAQDTTDIYPGGLSSDRKYLITGLRATMSNFGTTDTTVVMQINNVDVFEFLIPYDTDTIYDYDWTNNGPLENGASLETRFRSADSDVISFRVDDPGTDAADLVICLRYRANSLYDNGGYSN